MRVPGVHCGAHRNDVTCANENTDSQIKISAPTDRCGHQKLTEALYLRMDSQFRDYSTYLKNLFGERVQKISINSGYTCPNRDGTKGRHGCTYCNLNALEPAYIRESINIREQIKNGIDYFKRRSRASRFLVYFQSYTNTYGDTERLVNDYEDALQFPEVVGLVIGTRPDCLDPKIIHHLTGLSRRFYIAVELGIESTYDATLQRVNRCHSYDDTVNAVHTLAGNGIPVGGHLILGFPWESGQMMVQHATRLSGLPLTFVKLHHLQILKGTALAREYRRKPFDLLTLDAYTELVITFLEHSRPDLVFQRFLAEAPLRWLVAPHWNGIRNYQFTDFLRKEMNQRGAGQGTHYQTKTSCLGY
jgi:radical SAM protein (TIGR01212 family)